MEKMEESPQAARRVNVSEGSERCIHIYFAFKMSILRTDMKKKKKRFRISSVFSLLEEDEKSNTVKEIRTIFCDEEAVGVCIGTYR